MLRDRQTLAATPDGTVRVVRADKSELPALLGVQHEAFGRVAEAFGIPLKVMPPVTETLEDLQGLSEGGMVFFVALAPDERVVGTVRGLEVGDTVEVGRLAVSDSFLRRGVATALMRGLEAAFPHAERFDLFTGAEAEGPINLYESLGYNIYATERFEEWSMVRMEKAARDALA